MRPGRWIVHQVGIFAPAIMGLVLGMAPPAAAISFTAIDLNPSGFTSSYATGVGGGQQVGYGFGATTGIYQHALLWTGTAASVVDLNPSGFTASEALGVGGGQQVGYGSGPATGFLDHALLWTGTAGSVVDLNAFLPPGFTSSDATGIDASGDIVGYASDAAGETHAFLWQPVAEPSSVLLLVVGLGALAGLAWRRGRGI